MKKAVVTGGAGTCPVAQSAKADLYEEHLV